MTYLSGDEEPTYHIPIALQRKLLEAKEWYDERFPHEGGERVPTTAGDDLLADIVEMCEQAWGFAPTFAPSGSNT